MFGFFRSNPVPDHEEIMLNIAPAQYYSHLRIIELVNTTRRSADEALFMPKRSNIYGWLSGIHNTEWHPFHKVLSTDCDPSITKKTSNKDITTIEELRHPKILQDTRWLMYRALRMHMNDELMLEYREEFKKTGKFGSFIDHFWIYRPEDIENNRVYLQWGGGWKPAEKDESAKAIECLGSDLWIKPV